MNLKQQEKSFGVGGRRSVGAALERNGNWLGRSLALQGIRMEKNV